MACLSMTLDVVHTSVVIILLFRDRSTAVMQNENVKAAAKATLLSVAINSALAAVKVVTGILGNSYALIADGIESINDVLSSLVVYASIRISAKPADEDHPYGHGKAEQLGALFSALSLLGAGATIVVQSSQNLFHRHTSPAWYTLPVLVLVIVVKELLSRYALNKGQETTSTALKGDAWHHRADAITSGAAFVGIVISLVGGPGFEKADDVAALLGCAVIGINGFKLLKTSLHENMDGAPPAELIERMRQIAAAVPQVKLIEKLRMKKSGLGYFMDIHVQVDAQLSVDEGHRIGGAVKARLMTEGYEIHDVVVHLEPYHGDS